MDKHRNADGTYDGAGVLGELSGLGRSTMVGLWEQVKANQAKLDACPGHEFVPTPRLETQRQRYRCKHCGGEVDATSRHWYELGRSHERAARLLP